MTSTFINTKAEAKLASAIASKHGFETLSAERFYKKYTSNVFSPWASENDARRAASEIHSAIKSRRAR